MRRSFSRGAFAGGGALRQDFAYALRTAAKKPGFAVTAILILALGIGANTAIFTVIRGVLLRPLGYPDAGRLVHVSGGATPVRFREMKATARSFAGLGAFGMEENLTLTGRSQPDVVKTVRISADFLGILEVAPLLGRGFADSEDMAGGQQSAMISAELWQRRFGGDPHVVGGTLMLSGTPYTVAGVLPVRFQFPFSGLDVWLTRPAETSGFASKSRALSPTLTIFARLRPDVTLEQADAEMAVIQRQYAMSHPAMLDAKPKSPVHLMPLKERLVANVRSILWMLFGAVSFVLLIACANVAALLLARGNARSREFAIRSALGATRGRLIRQLLAESLLLSGAGGLAGIWLAIFSLRSIPHIAAFDLPRASEVHADWLVLAFAAVLSLATGILFGLAPALNFSRSDLIASLRSRGETANGGLRANVRSGATIRSALVIGQVALSIVLLIGAAILIESMVRLQRQNLGFNPEGLLTMRLSLPLSRYDTDQKRNGFFEALIARVESLPGVRGAAAAMTLPMTGFAGSPVQDANKPPLRLNERPIATILIVSPDYFRTLQISLRRGRTFSRRDRGDTQRVAVIDEGLARQLWPEYPAGLDPVGQRLFIGGTNPAPAEIVGIARNVHQNVENTGWPGSVYEPFAQNPLPSGMLAIRTDSSPGRMAAAVRAQVQSLDREQPIANIQTMNDLIETQLGQRRLLLALLTSFAGAALVLALIGVYGAISYSVAQRTQELGIRRALGAHDREIIALILGYGVRLALAGAVCGVSAAFVLSRVLKTLVFHVSTTDPAIYAAVACLFVLAASIASYIPARRAMRSEPAAALRNE
jgi:predicted permease